MRLLSLCFLLSSSALLCGAALIEAQAAPATSTEITLTLTDAETGSPLEGVGLFVGDRIVFTASDGEAVLEIAPGQALALKGIMPGYRDADWTVRGGGAAELPMRPEGAQ